MLYIGLPFLLLMLCYAGYLFQMALHFARIPQTRASEDLQSPASAHPSSPTSTDARNGRSANPRIPESAVPLPSITVIVPARNEAGKVGPCVSAILAQDYPRENLQLLLIDDQSEDATAAQARAAANHDPRFRLLQLETRTGVAYKKAAVAAGITQSSGEWIVTTDADCQAGPGWLKAMAAQFQPGTAMVSGPVALTGSGMFREFQALEFMGLIAVGAGAIQSGHPTMCNGANLAYRRTAFEEVGGFQGIDHIASGDDELLMHKMAAAGMGIRFAKSKDAIVHTPAQPDWQGFKAQRTRWVSKSTHYKRSRITLTLTLAYLAMLGFPLLAVAGFWEPWLWAILGLNLLLKMAGEAAVLFQAAAFFDNLRLLRWFPLEQAAHVAYVLWVGLAGNRKAYTWKGRRVK